MGVDLGGAEVGVSEQFLDAAEISSVVQEVGGEAVAEFVRTDFESDAGMAEVFLEEVVDGAHGDAAPEFAEEEWPFMDAGGGAVVLDGAEGGATDGANPVLAAFAGDAQGFFERVDIAHVQLDQFVETQAGAVEQLEDGRIALRGPGGGTLGSFQFQGEGKRQEFVDL